MGGGDGVGIRVESTAAGWAVSELVRKGPAHLSGKVKVGDLIVSVDGTRIHGASSTLAPLMIGLPGSEVTLGLLRNPGGPTISVKLARGGPAVEPARSRSAMEGSLQHHQHGSWSLQQSLDSTISNSFILKESYESVGGGMSRPATAEGVPGALRLGTGDSIVDAGVRTSFAYEIPHHHDADSLEFSGVAGSGARRTRSMALLPGMSRGRNAHSSLATPFLLDLSEPEVPMGRASPAGTESPTQISRVKNGTEVMLGSGLGQARAKKASDQESEREKTLAIIMRTPEGKIWKAEVRREREQEEEELRRRLSMDALMGDVGGGKFNLSNAKSGLEWTIYNAQKIPAPNLYNPEKPRRGIGGKFSESKRDMSLVPRGQRDIPGPCSYHPDPLALRPSKVVSMGNSERKTNVDTLVYYAKDMPGPGEYEVHQQPQPGPSAPSSSGAARHKPRPRAAHDTRPPDNAAVPGPGSYPIFGMSHRGGSTAVQGGVIPESLVPSMIDLELARASTLPGPQDYDPKHHSLSQGGRFSTSMVPSNVDMLCRESAKLPGPGQYRPRIKQTLGFAKSTSKGSAIDNMAKQAAQVPGPGQYGAPGRGLGDGVGGGKMSEARPLTNVEVLQRRAGGIPGPGAYGFPKDPRKDTIIGARFGPPPAAKSAARIEAENVSRGPGPAAYCSNVPDPMGIPGTELGWKALETYHPFMRYRAR